MFGLGLVVRNIVSSAKRDTVTWFRVEISLIYIRYNVGAKQEDIYIHNNSLNGRILIIVTLSWFIGMI